MAQGFAKNEDWLSENYKIDDQLNFSSSVDDFSGFLKEAKNTSLIGLIGPYGSGKSTMLYQLEKKESDRWYVFDAWSFPNRKDLWEGFILEFSKKISPDLFEKSRERIEGTSQNNIKSLINVLSEGLNLFIPGAGIVKNLTTLFKSSPARRVFEMKELLSEVMDKAEGSYYFVLEDVDRAGIEGAVFLETLKKFLKDEELKQRDNRLVFIIPIASTARADLKLKESYDKSIDYFYEFQPRLNFEKFVEDIFEESFFINNKLNWKEHLCAIFNFYTSHKTIRDLKNILRQANYRFISLSKITGFKPDPRMVILMAIYYDLGENILHRNLERNVKKIPSLGSPDKFYKCFTQAVHDDVKVTDLMGRQTTFPELVFVQNHNYITPQNWEDMFSTERNYWIQVSDLYLKEKDKIS